MADGPSKLTTGQIIDADANPKTVSLTSEEFRNSLTTRNLFDSSHSYGDNTIASKLEVMGVSLNSVLQVIPQYQSVSLQNSMLSRVGRRLVGGDLSNLEIIGTQMLAKQMFYNSASHLAQNYLGSIDIMRALKGGKLYQRPVDYSITKDANAGLLDRITSAAFFKTNITGTGYPFSNTPTNVTYIQNTGTAQLSKFYQAINYNLYKPLNKNDVDTQELIKYSGQDYADVPITKQFNLVSTNLQNNKNFFSFDDIKKYPYLSIVPTKINEFSVFTGNLGMRYSYSDSITDNYAPDIQYVNDNFGKTNKTPDRNDKYEYIDSLDRDDVNNKLIWGRDGISSETKNESKQSHGYYDGDIINNTTSEFLDTQFKVKRGLLEYTRNLVNATSGQFIDLTRKVFTEGDKVVAFNGSPLWQANNSKYANYSQTAEKTGIRQHSMIDQYNRFTKAIRYNGNIVYNGNQNSVIYQSVVPRIHPTRDNNGGDINNKNLMFSIENLAVQTIKRDNYGVIDDESGSPIPLSEVGPFMGRIMWFPPYDLQLNETATAKYESTVMVGRNEPMYSYMNSERTATLSFTLIVDYPPHLRMHINDPNYRKNVANFFAFGGNPLPPEESIVKLESRITELQNQKTKMTGPTVQSQPDITEFDTKICFPNNLPEAGQENNIIDIMYKNALHYEIIKGCPSHDGSSNGLNKDIYFITGLTKTGANTWKLDPNFETKYPNFSQYTAGSVNQQSDVVPSVNQLNNNIKKYFENPENRQYYKIQIIGTASKLYEIESDEPEYNRQLGLRRANAAKYFIESRIKAVLGISDISDIVISTDSTGSEGQSKAGAKKENKDKPEVKAERSAKITFLKNGNVAPKKDVKKTQEIAKIDAEIMELQTKLNRLRNLKDNIFNTRKYEEEKSILNTFESSKENYYYPAFQTQTPEDFHRRLTFLQQCTRQGSAKRYAMEVDNNGILRAKNSVFGRQPICILRIGDFFYTKVIIDNVTVDYNDTTWDMNPEGMGMQPMIAKVTLQLKVIGGQSLKGPIDALQNAASFNYYANSTYNSTGMYKVPSDIATNQDRYIKKILAENKKNLNNAYNAIINAKQSTPT